MGPLLEQATKWAEGPHRLEPSPEPVVSVGYRAFLTALEELQEPSSLVRLVTTAFRSQASWMYPMDWKLFSKLVLDAWLVLLAHDLLVVVGL